MSSNVRAENAFLLEAMANPDPFDSPSYSLGYLQGRTRTALLRFENGDPIGAVNVLRAALEATKP